MPCGQAHTEVNNTRRFVDATACGQKFESVHFRHFCEDCGNQDSALCMSECWHGPTCHFKTRETTEVAASMVPRLEGEMMG
jgi:hypothetical protein